PQSAAVTEMPASESNETIASRLSGSSSTSKTRAGGIENPTVIRPDPPSNAERPIRHIMSTDRIRLAGRSSPTSCPTRHAQRRHRLFSKPCGERQACVGTDEAVAHDDRCNPHRRQQTMRTDGAGDRQPKIDRANYGD